MKKKFISAIIMIILVFGVACLWVAAGRILSWGESQQPESVIEQNKNKSFLKQLVSERTITPKKEAQALLARFLNSKSTYNVLRAEIKKSKAPLGSEEFFTHLNAVNQKLKETGEKLASVNVSKEVEPLKKAMLAENQYVTNAVDLDIKEKNQNLANLKSDTFKKNILQKRYERLNEACKLIEGRPFFVLGINGKNYAAIPSPQGGLWTVTNAEIRRAIYSNYFSEKPLGKFIVVTVFVKNHGKRPISLSSSSVKLIDDQKREFVKASSAQTLLNIATNQKDYVSNLNPGMSFSFQMVFDVPQDMQPEDFRLDGAIELTPWIITTVKN